jgi:hypothetical protein
LKAKHLKLKKKSLYLKKKKVGFSKHLICSIDKKGTKEKKRKAIIHFSNTLPMANP